jgi:hypothetical protein
MASRTYLPTLLTVLEHVCHFIVAHRDRIIKSIGTNNAAKLDAVVTACHVLTEVIIPLIEVPV